MREYDGGIVPRRFNRRHHDSIEHDAQRCGLSSPTWSTLFTSIWRPLAWRPIWPIDPTTSCRYALTIQLDAEGRSIASNSLLARHCHENGIAAKSFAMRDREFLFSIFDVLPAHRDGPQSFL